LKVDFEEGTTMLETGRRLVARKMARSVVRILPEADDLVAINRVAQANPRAALAPR
jgi:hypothetical protein